MKYFIFSMGLLLSTSLSFAGETQIDEKLLSQLTLREKIGQLCFIATAIDEKMDHVLIEDWFKWQPLYHLERQYIENLIKEYHIGGVVFYGNKALPQQVLLLTKYYQSISKVPLLMTIDAELGLGSRLDDKYVLRFPYNMTLGATQNLDLTYQTGYETGKQLKSLGLHVNFAPVIDLNNNPDNPVIGVRSFGSNKEQVTSMGIAYMQGLHDAGIVACAKHFPGHGDTSTDSHVLLPLITHSLEHLHTYELYPFKKLIEAGIPSIMTAHLEIPCLEKNPGIPSSLSKSIVTELLQEKMGFDGLIFTDALGMKGVSNHFEPGELELRALQAGNDVLLCPVDVVKVIDRVEKAVQQKEIMEEEIDRKVLKILQTKKWALEQQTNPEINLESSLNSKKAQELRQSIFNQAMTCLKSDPSFLDQLTNAKVVVMNTDSALIDFEKTLKQSTSYSIFQESYKGNSFKFVDYFKKFWNGFDQALKEASHVIISVSNNSFIDQNVQPLVNQIMDLKAKGKNITLVIFSSPYLIPATTADNVILAYEPVSDAQIAAARTFSRDLNPEGILPVEMHE